MRDSATGEALPHARVGLIDLRRWGETNADGRFSFVGVPTDGPHTLRVQYIGYRVFQRVVPADSTRSTLVITLVRAAVMLGETKVTAAGDQAITAVVGTGVSHVSLSTSQVEAMPSLGEVDVFRTLQMLPSVSGTGDGSANLSVRGGTPDQNLVLLDGMTVYHVDHFFGMFSAFNTDALKDIQLYAGGFPAPYGGRLSSVVDLTGKSGDEQTVRGSAGLNFLSARGELEIPLGRGSWLISGRRSYTDVIKSSLYNRLFDVAGGTTSTSTGTPTLRGPRGGANAFRQQTEAPSFYFYDFNSKLTYRPSGRDVVALSLYSGRDNLDQSQSAAGGFGGGGPGGPGTSPPSSQDLTIWGNQGASGRWFRQWSDRFSSDAIVAASRYASDGQRTANGGVPNGPAFNFGFDETNRVDDVTMRIDNELHVASWSRIQFGSWITNNRVTYAFDVNSGDTTQRNRNTARDGRALLSAMYAQQIWTPVSALEITTGARLNSYSATRKSYIEPRAAATLQVSSYLALKVAWGRYHQFVNRVENEDVLQGSRDFWLLSDSSLVPSEAEHRVVGISMDRRHWALNVEAYDKTLSHVPLFSRRYRQAFGVNTGAFFYEGNGRAKGLEFLAQKKTGALTGWATYTLAKGTSTYADINNGNPFPSEYDQRHEAKAFAAYTRGAWEVSATALHGSGRPYTAPESQYQLKLLDGTVQTYVHVGDKNSLRLPPYERGDVAISRLFRTDALDWKLGLSLYNVTNYRNVAYRKFDLSQAPILITDVTELGFLPSLDLKVTLRDFSRLTGIGGNR